MNRRVRIFFPGLLLGLMLCGCGEESAPGESPENHTAAVAEAGRESGQGTVSELAPGPPEEPGDDAAEQDPGEEEPAFSFLMEEASVYAYNSLTDMEKIWYRDMEEILGTFGTERKISRACLESGLDEADVDRIFQCVLNDHPELFYVEGYSYVRNTRGDKTVSIVFSGSYSVDFDTAVERKAQIEAAAGEILAGVSGDASDYAKVKYVYETLIRNTDYQLNSPDNQNIYSVFVNKTSVCQGYAKATQYLLNRLGIGCSLVLGTVDTGELHAWNLVKLDDSYYYMDTTWGDASYQAGGEGEYQGCVIPEINYDYFCVTTEELLKTHTLGGPPPMPLCDATKNSYYVQEGALFTDYDREQMRELFRRAEEQGRTDVSMKCADIICYQEIASAMIGGQEVFDYYSENRDSVAYAQNDIQLSLTFWVTNE